jgi:RHS repeat-associated protein
MPVTVPTIGSVAIRNVGGTSMFKRRWMVAVAVASSLSLTWVGLPAVAAPLEVETPTPAAEIVEPAPSPLDEVWEPDGDAAAAEIPEAEAPVEEWSEPPANRVLSDGTAQRAPAGTVVGAPGLGALPYYGFDETSLSADTTARVNLGNGNLLLTANDSVLNGPSLSVRNDRFYNGLSSTAGSFGGGWSSAFSPDDVGLQVTSTQATLIGPNGFKAVFTKSGSTWVAPAGFNATLVDGQGLRTLTYNKTGEQFVFNSAGYIMKNVDRNGEGTTYEYDVSVGLLTKVYAASGRFYEIEWGIAGTADVITSITDSAGRVTTYTSNTAGQLIRVDAPGGFWEKFIYDSIGRLSEIHFVGNAGIETAVKVAFAYDTKHRVTSMSRGLLSASDYLTTTTYTYATGLTTVKDGRGKSAKYTIDTQGRVTKATDALGRVRANTWTANSDVATTTDATTPGQTTTYSYDALNNAVGTTLPTGAAASAAYATGVGCAGTGGTAYQPKCTTDAAGAGKAFEYDAKGNPTKVTDTTSGGTGAVPQRFTYESGGTVCGGFDGQICTSTDGNNHVTTNTYDADGNLVAVAPPAPQGDTTYTYDALGRVLTVTDGNDDTTTYEYNVRDEIVSTVFDGGATLTTKYYPNGLKSKEFEGTGPAKYFYYDALARQTRETTVTTSTVEVNLTYDAAGNTTSYKDNHHAGQVNYVYDDANQLVQLVEPEGACPTGTGSPANSGCIRFAYDNNGAETLRTFPGNAKLITVNDASARPTRITAKDSAGVTKVDIGYSYTAPGGSGPSADRAHIQTRTSHLETGITAGAITTYGYDSLSRLKSATERTGSTTSASWTYAYDGAGNRTNQIRTGNTGAPAGTTAYGYDNANRLITTTGAPSAWTYDAAGNQTKNGATGQTASFNSRGAVAGIGTTTYSAFGQGNTEQLTRSASSTRYLNSPLGLMTEDLDGAARTFDRTPSGDAVGNRLNNGTRRYYATDHLGSVVGMFNFDGTYLGGYSYSPYGEQRAISSGTVMTVNSLRYIGGYLDSASGLYKLGARYYDPSIGRFTQYDPSGQESHPYGYAACNPINSKDPSGLDACGEAVASLVLLLASAGLGLAGAAPSGGLTTIGLALAAASFPFVLGQVGTYCGEPGPNTNYVGG